MLLAYSWATIQPIEKLFYNFLVTALSAVVALLIGSLETVQVVVDQLDLKGFPWDHIRSVNMATLGFTIIVIFGVMFGLSVAYTVWNRESCSFQRCCDMQCESCNL